MAIAEIASVALPAIADLFSQKGIQEKSAADRQALAAQVSFQQNQAATNERLAREGAGVIQNVTPVASGALTGQAAQARTDLAGGFGQARSDVQGGIGNARSTLSSMLTDPGSTFEGFQTSPGFQFRQQQGEQGINRAAAARGGRNSGRTLKDLSRFNQGLASSEFDKFSQRRLAESGQNRGTAGQLAGLQQQAGISLGGLSARGGEQAANVSSGLGSNLSNLITGQGNSIANLISGVGAANSPLAQQLLGQFTRPSETAGLGSAQTANAILAAGNNVAALG